MEPRTSSPKNIHPCIFLGCKFAGQTCYCVVPPTSVSGMIRRGVIFSQQRHIGKHTFRKPFEIDDADARSLGEIKRRRTDCTLSIYFSVATPQMRRIFQKVC